jgi:hypothetical protein
VVRPGTGRAVRGRVARLAAVLMLPVALGAARGVRHPLHTTLTRIARGAEARTLDVTVRVFVDDFSAAVARRGGAGGPAVTPPPDSAAHAYVAAALTLTDGAGHRVPLRWVGARRTNDLLWLSFVAGVPTADGLRVANQLLVELHADQVNIVQADVGGRRTSLLFTRGDGPKPLR